MANRLRSIVLIDDNETTKFLNNLLLERLAIADRLVFFTRADQAYEEIWGSLATAEVPDLVFVDLKMPGMDGFEFLELHSKLPEEVRARTVLTVLTTSMHASDVARVTQFEGVEYLAKPLTVEKMTKLLEKRF